LPSKTSSQLVLLGRGYARQDCFTLWTVLFYHIADIKNMRHSKKVIENIKNLRRSGMSILEIVAVTGISKTTIWHHIQEVVLTPELKKIIRSKQGGSNKRSEENWKKAKIQAQKLLASKGKMKEFFCIVAMLYWAEGSKRELVFTNTDISMINLYLKFMILALGIDRKIFFC